MEVAAIEKRHADIPGCQATSNVKLDRNNSVTHTE